MEQKIIRKYEQLQRRLNEARDTSLLEMAFVVWAYLSPYSGKNKIPHELSLRHWVNHSLQPGELYHELKKTFRQLDKHVPELKGIFEKVHGQIIDSPGFSETLYRFENVFRELLYEEITPKVWVEIFKKAYEGYLRRNRFFISDPADVCELMSKSFARLSHETQLLEAESPKVPVYIPFLHTGDMAVALHETTDGKFRMIGRESNQEAFIICMLYCCVNNIDTSDFEQVSFDQSLVLEKKYSLLSVFPVGFNEDEMYTALLPKYFSGSPVSVVMVPQSFLFSRKYEKIRKWMIYDGYVRAMVSMPTNAMFYSRARMVLLVFDKNNWDRKILVVNAENINKDNRRQTRLTQEQIDDLVEVIYKKEERKNFSKLINIEVFREMNLNININALVPDEDVVEMSQEDLLQQIKQKEDELSGLEHKIKQDFSKLLNLD